jgi:hypothetical protein
LRFCKGLESFAMTVLLIVGNDKPYIGSFTLYSNGRRQNW